MIHCVQWIAKFVCKLPVTRDDNSFSRRLFIQDNCPRASPTLFLYDSRVTTHDYANTLPYLVATRVPLL